MKTSRFADSQIIAILKQTEAGTPVPELCREHGLSSTLFYKRCAKYSGMNVGLMSHMKDLEAENAHHLFESVSEVQDFATRWLWLYNHERQNMVLDGIATV